MFSFLLVVHALIASALVGVILMQRSEGGGFAGGGSPAGLMSARGAGDFLTRTTAILAVLFVTLSILMSAFAGINRKSGGLDDSLKRPVVEAPVVDPTPTGLTPEQQAAIVAQQQQMAESEKKQSAGTRKPEAPASGAARPKLVAPKVSAPEVGSATGKVTKVETTPAPAAPEPSGAGAPTP